MVSVFSTYGPCSDILLVFTYPAVCVSWISRVPTWVKTCSFDHTQANLKVWVEASEHFLHSNVVILTLKSSFWSLQKKNIVSSTLLTVLGLTDRVSLQLLMYSLIFVFKVFKGNDDATFSSLKIHEDLRSGLQADKITKLMSKWL